MSPSEAAQKGWEEFERLIRNMSREDYAEACEELQTICDASARAVREEIQNENDND